MSSETKQPVRALKREDISHLCENLAMLLRAGIPLYVAFESIEEEFSGTSYEGTIKRVSDIIRETGSLKIAFDEVPCVPSYMQQMITVGEQSGRLEEVLTALSVYYTRMDAIQKKTRSTVFYPIILLIMMTAAIIVLIAAILPIFSSVLAQFDAELTANATSALSWARGISFVILGIVVLIILVAAVFLLISRSSGGQKSLSGFLAHFPLTKNVYQKLSVAQFVSFMAMLLKSGITPEKALEQCINITTDKSLLEKLKHSQDLVMNGEAWGDALEKAHIFTPVGDRMIMIGLSTGTLDSSMERIAGYYESDVMDEFNAIVGVIEPVLITVLTVIIGVIMLCAMLPLIRIIPSIG